MAPTKLDQLVQQSKQITEDLMAVRREAKCAVSSRRAKDSRRRVEDRLYLVLNSLYALTEDVREAWRQAAGIDEIKYDGPAPELRSLDNGQLKLVSGDR